MSPNPRKRKRASSASSSSSAPAENVTVLSAVRESRDELKGKRPPTVDQLTRALGKAVGYGSVLVASQLVDGDPRLADDDEEAAAVELLAMTPDEAASIVHPLARYVGGSKLNSSFGRTIVDHSDLFDCTYALTEWLARTRRYQRHRRAAEAAGITATPENVREAQPFRTTPPPRTGVVMTPDMIHTNGHGPQPIVNAQENL